MGLACLRRSAWSSSRRIAGLISPAVLQANASADDLKRKWPRHCPASSRTIQPPSGPCLTRSNGIPGARTAAQGRVNGRSPRIPLAVCSDGTREASCRSWRPTASVALERSQAAVARSAFARSVSTAARRPLIHSDEVLVKLVPHGSCAVRKLSGGAIEIREGPAAENVKRE